MRDIFILLFLICRVFTCLFQFAGGIARSTGDTSTHVGGIFETEFFSRDCVNITSAEHRQFDLFGYADGDIGVACVDDPNAGVKVVKCTDLQPPLAPLPK